MRSLNFKFNSTLVLLVACLLAVAYGVYQTGRDDAVAPAGTRRAPSDRSIIVDQSSLITAEQLVREPRLRRVPP